ncbi:MAG: DinB family protein [Thermoanaerobaculia bacterium]
MSRPGRRLVRALEEHRAALAAFVRRASEVPPEGWRRSPAPGKWSPAEITEHVTLAVEKLHLELQGEPPMKVILSPWVRLYLRWMILPGILRTGRFPPGARAPREIRPSEPAAPQLEALRRLEAAHARFEAACAEPSAAGRFLTHPYFGPLPIARYHRLLARHAQHHGRQLPDRQGESS